MSLKFIRNDITKVRADAIVNSANPKPAYGAGSDLAVYQAAGSEKLLEARRAIGDIAVGEARETPAFALDAKYIIHTVGPAWVDGAHGEHDAVRACYANSLKLAQTLGCESIAFPLIATGNYGFPKEDALQIAVSECSHFLLSSDMEITLVVFDPESFVLSGRIFSGIDEFIDENYAGEKAAEEYGSISDPLKQSGLPVHGSAAFAGMASASAGPRGFGKIIASKTSRSAKARIPAKQEAPLGSPMEKPAFFAAASFTQMDDSLEDTASPALTLEEAVSRVGESFHAMLFRMIDERGYKDPDVYKRANIDRKLFSKIRSSEDYKPRKSTVIALALALKLNLDDTKDLLGRAGYALSPANISDLIVEYFIRQEVYDIYQINLALFDHGQECL